ERFVSSTSRRCSKRAARSISRKVCAPGCRKIPRVWPRPPLKPANRDPVSDRSHPRDAYAAAGVDYDKLDRGKRLAQSEAQATAVALRARGYAEIAESRGESAYVVDIGDAYITTVTEALGTKNLIADAVRPITGKTHYDSIAQDTVATILNDLATVG